MGCFQQSQFHVSGWGFLCGDLRPILCLGLGKVNLTAFSRDRDLAQEVLVAVSMEGSLAGLCHLTVILQVVIVSAESESPRIRRV